jgi:hypothetical protein
MEDRLSQLHFLPPPVSTPWTGAPTMSVGTAVKRQSAGDLTLPLPLFWYDPHWSLLPTDLADDLAVAVSSHDVLVSALNSDVAGANVMAAFLSDRATAQAGSSSGSDDQQGETQPTFLPRILPYRPERYGLNPIDFDHAQVIDVRLMMTRDVSGRFAYSQEQIARWEATPAEAPLAGGGWVPAATFPPDVESMDQLGSKFDQLRSLAPDAGIFASMGPYRLEDELPPIIAAKPDGLILRLDEVALEGLQLAALTRRARQLMKQAGAKQLPLWIVPGDITPDDAAKLVALGADGIGIDAWCDPLIDLSLVSTDSYGYARRPNVEELVEDNLPSMIERFAGLYLSLQRVPKKERLGSFSATWAKTLGVLALK